METTTKTLTVADNTNREQCIKMLAAAESIPPEIRNATLTTASWVRVIYQDPELRKPLDGMQPDDRDANGLWITKVWPDAAEPGGYACARVMIPWSSIRQVRIMAVDTTDQPF